MLRPGAHCKGTELLCRATGTFLTYTATAGETVEIVVDSTGAQGRFALAISGPAWFSGSSGDQCTDFDLANVLGDTVLNGLLFGGSTIDLGCGFPENTGGLAAKWRAPRAGTFVFDSSRSSFDTAIDLRGSCSGPLIACGGADGTSKSRVTASLSSGQVVTISVHALSANAVEHYFALGITG